MASDEPEGLYKPNELEQAPTGRAMTAQGEALG
jgi:hypothetical protein